VSLSSALWAASADQAAAALAHPFVRGLADGSLPRGAFQGYVAQDAYFLESFARAYALALAYSPDRPTLDAFADLIGGVRDELRLHASYAQQWGVDLTDVGPAPATTAYTDFVLVTAALSGVGLTCAAMVPCMRLYAHLGQSLAAEGPGGPYAHWVTTYADPAFDQLASRLEGLLDAHAEDGPGVRATYGRAMDLELRFFDAALATGT
jgi:thiaminase/transcriptional activator TenA